MPHDSPRVGSERGIVRNRERKRETQRKETKKEEKGLPLFGACRTKSARLDCGFGLLEVADRFFFLLIKPLFLSPLAFVNLRSLPGFGEEQTSSIQR